MIPKFRAWYTPFKGEKYGRKMKYGSAGSLITHAEMSPDKYILMQSTGLKDKNGVEIYEGDVDRSESGEISVIVYLIKAGSYCVMPLEIYLNEDFQNANFFPELLYNFGYDCTFDNQISEKYLNIVGNIYENLELTKEVGP